MIAHEREFMAAAQLTAQRSNCIRRAVGAVLVRGDRIIGKGWNGVSLDSDCGKAGCPRCVGGGITGSGYDRCMCIHAEQNAIAIAAREGVSTANSVLYVNLRPCIQCLAISRAAGVCGVVFDENWSYDEETERAYAKLAAQFDVFKQIGAEQSAEALIGLVR